MKILILFCVLFTAIAANAGSGYFDYGKFCLQDGVCKIWINPSSHFSANGNEQFLVSFGDRCWTDNGWNFNGQTHLLELTSSGLQNLSAPNIGVDGRDKHFYLGNWHFYACY